MFSSRAATERRLRLLRWLDEQGESGGYEMSRGAKIRLYHLYPLLTKLENLGIVSRRWTEGDRPRVMYKLTAAGEQVLSDSTSP
jgi:DNA-binding PadR family transcriptional regulator